jgi:hypothetical protein
VEVLGVRGRATCTRRPSLCSARAFIGEETVAFPKGLDWREASFIMVVKDKGEGDNGPLGAVLEIPE